MVTEVDIDADWLISPEFIVTEYFHYLQKSLSLDTSVVLYLLPIRWKKRIFVYSVIIRP